MGVTGCRHRDVYRYLPRDVRFLYSFGVLARLLFHSIALK